MQNHHAADPKTNSVTMTQTMRRNPSMQNRTILIQCDRALSEAASRFGKRGILQLSMDGPNVNWKTFDLLQAEVETETGRSLLNIGSCGLHIMHNAFRRAFLGTKWAIDSALQSLHWLFKDAPAKGR